MSIERKKYPRTSHWVESPGATSDDKIGSPAAHAHMASGIPLIVTEKLDGSNFTIAHDFCYGRSVDANSNIWDAPVRKMWSEKRWDLPENMLISGENMWARKSVGYDNLPSVFMVFGIWVDDVLLSWEDTKEWCELLDFKMVPVLYSGNNFDEATKVWFKTHNTETSEGFVIRNADAIQRSDFSMNLLKWVRSNHIRTEDSWRHRDDFPRNTFIESF